MQTVTDESNHITNEPHNHFEGDMTTFGKQSLGWLL